MALIPIEGELARREADAADAIALAFLAGFRNAGTRSAYARDLRDWARFCREHGVDPLRARRADLDVFARALEAAGRSPATVARRLSTLSGFYRYALEEGHIEKSPAAHLRRPDVPEESQTLGLDRAELARLLEAAEAAGARDHALTLLLSLNGLRVSEAVGADVEHLRTERGHRVLEITRKGGKVQLAPLAPRTAAALDEHLAGRDSGPLFAGAAGERLSRQGAWRVIVRLAKAAGIEKRIHPHSMRHTFVTLALDAGVSLRDVQDAAGHADPRTTRRYDRARQSLDRHATYAVAAHVAS